MRKVELRMNEEYKYKIIKKLVETNGNKQRASVTLKKSIRQIDRMIAGYKNMEKNSLYMVIVIESLNSTYKRINRNRNVFPTDMSLLKVLYLSTLKAEKKWSRMVDKWDLCLSQFRIMYEGRI